MYACVCVYVYVCMYTYIHTYARAHTHIKIYNLIAGIPQACLGMSLDILGIPRHVPRRP